MAKSLGIEDRVGFIPFQSNPCWVYRSLDIVVHASTRPEPFGLTIVEAMACAKPVVVSAAGGAGELFEHGVSGFGFSRGSDIELANVLRNLIANGASWSRIGIAARKRVEQEFSSDVFGDSLLRIYDTILNAR
jgi:glycosyltransferase involved in cell wall biosynthesis